MRNIILFDNDTRDHLLPFTFTKPACEIRLGIFTIREKWEHWLEGSSSYITVDYLSEKYDITISEHNYLINGSLIPSKELCTQILEMEEGEAMLKGGELLAAVLNKDQFERLMTDSVEELSSFEVENFPIEKLNNVWDIFLLNDSAIRSDFEWLTEGRTSAPLSSTNRVIGDHNLFLEEGTKAECAVFNTSDGPIYLGSDSEVMEGVTIRGPFVLGEGSIVKMGAKIYGGTTIGPDCVVGGEIKNSVLFANSNKSHEGYLGNSVIGEWCNLGADTNCSNMKNNWSDIKIWNYVSGDFKESGQMKAGLFMGDFSMSGINTMFNTGTIVGLCCNVFGSEMSSKFIPSFSWGGGKDFNSYKPDKAFATIEKMMRSKGKFLNSEDRLLLLKVFEETAKYRFWEKAEKGSEKKFYNLFD